MNNVIHTVTSPLTVPTAVFAAPTYPLIDTHTHFDDAVFDNDRLDLAHLAYQAGVQHLVLIGYLAKYFNRMTTVYGQLNDAKLNQDYLNQASPSWVTLPTPHLAFGLHPAYIADHTQADLDTVADMLTRYPAIAIGEIGLDTYTKALKMATALDKQTYFFKAQLDLAISHNLPVLLHIRKAHAECLAVLKAHGYAAHQLGGIAHSFSGGIQEAKAFIKMGFKLGVTGQVTNPNAKKLRRTLVQAVADYGIGCLVLETDCPDMTPLSCQHQLISSSTSASTTSLSASAISTATSATSATSPPAASATSPSTITSSALISASPLQKQPHTHNVPANLKVVLHALSALLNIDSSLLAMQLWQNSCTALNVAWPCPKA